MIQNSPVLKMRVALLDWSREESFSAVLLFKQLDIFLNHSGSCLNQLTQEFPSPTNKFAWCVL